MTQSVITTEINKAKIKDLFYSGIAENRELAILLAYSNNYDFEIFLPWFKELFSSECICPMRFDGKIVPFEIGKYEIIVKSEFLKELELKVFDKINNGLPEFYRVLANEHFYVKIAVFCYQRKIALCYAEFFEIYTLEKLNKILEVLFTEVVLEIVENAQPLY